MATTPSTLWRTRSAETTPALRRPPSCRAGCWRQTGAGSRHTAALRYEGLGSVPYGPQDPARTLRFRRTEGNNKKENPMLETSSLCWHKSSFSGANGCVEVARIPRPCRCPRQQGRRHGSGPHPRGTVPPGTPAAGSSSAPWPGSPGTDASSGTMNGCPHITRPTSTWP
jgi:hypothetical protein